MVMRVIPLFPRILYNFFYYIKFLHQIIAFYPWSNFYSTNKVTHIHTHNELHNYFPSHSFVLYYASFNNPHFFSPCYLCLKITLYSSQWQGTLITHYGYRIHKMFHKSFLSLSLSLFSIRLFLFILCVCVCFSSLCHYFPL